MKILKLNSSNVKRLVAVEIQPDGSVVVIGGKNGAGKTSVLDSIMYALAGGKALPAEPVRKGERRAKIVVDLEGGLRVTRTFDPSGSKLTVTDQGTKRSSPQKLLNGLCGQISFDPLEYSRMSAKAQAEVLRRLVGVDTTELDELRAGAYEARRDANRDAKRTGAELATMEQHDGVERVDVAALADDLARCNMELSAHEQQSDKLHVKNGHARAMVASEASLTEEIIAAAELIKKMEADRKVLRKDITKIRADNKAAAAVLDGKRPALEMAIVQADQRLRSADDTNKMARENEEYSQKAARLDRWEAETRKFSDEIARIDDAKREALAEADFPIDGLGFCEDGVTLAGVPLEQASQAELLRVSVAMGLALNPTLRVLLIRDGSLLDDDSMRLIAEMAAKADAQVWLERVGEGDKSAIIIEDGQIRSPANADS